MSLEYALANYQAWLTPRPLRRRPMLVTRLNSGSINSAFLVSTDSNDDGFQFVVCIRAQVAEGLSLGFREEEAILRRAAAQDLAPRVVFSEPDRGILVTEYLRNNNAVSSAGLGRLIAGIHRLPAFESDHLDLLERIGSSYEGALRRGIKSDQLISPNAGGLPELVALHASSPRVQCHNDLNPTNVFCTNGAVRAIDWEYAGVGSPYFDAATVQVTWAKINSRELLSEVFPQGYSETLLRAAQLIYRAVEWNWYQATGLSTPPHCHVGDVRKSIANFS